MNRIRKKIEKRSAKLLIQSGIFQKDDYDDLNIIFYSTDYWGDPDEINPWNYLYDLAVDATVEYVEVDLDSGYYTEFGKKCDLSIIDAIRVFKENYLNY